MNNERLPLPASNHFKALQILDELSRNDSLTQRDLSSHLGIALGLVNSYIKNLVAKGFITVKAIPPKRYTYYLTPKGFAEKTDLTYQLLQDYTRIYREARNKVKKLYQEMEHEGIRRVVFAGVDEVAEIAFITLQEFNLKLIGVVDAEPGRSNFFQHPVQPVTALAAMEYDCIVVTSYLKRETLCRELLRQGVKKRSIRVIFPGK